MFRTARIAGIALGGGILAAGLVSAAPAAAPAAAAAQPAGCAAQLSSADHYACGTLHDGAIYTIEVPPRWNGTLFLYSHGYVAPGSSNPAQDVGDPVTGGWLLGHGFALAGSSYASTGWAIRQAFSDQIGTLNAFYRGFGHPTRTIAWGHSLGGIITAGLIQRYADRFSAALPMCGVLSGGVATWNTVLDSEFAFQRLIDPSVRVVNITNPQANLAGAEQATAAAQQTPQGEARLALVAALSDIPGWFTPLSPEPAATDYAGQESNQFAWETQVDFPFAFAFRAELEARAGGNPSWNTGVNYAADLANSADYAEVTALYKAAGLSLTKDLQTLDNAARIRAKPSAVSYLERYVTFDGQLSMPVLTMHTTGDGLVVPENEQAYSSVVNQAGDGNLLRQVFVHRAGHCAFTPAETITAAQVLLNRLDSGRWDLSALSPASLNDQATALGPAYSIFSLGGTIYPTAPAFVSYQPSAYLRPFDLGGQFGG